MIVLDTNVLSEIIRPKASKSVLDWFVSEPTSRLFTTAITEAEILYGIALLSPGRRRRALETAAQAMFVQEFAGRVLPFDSASAEEYAAIAAARRRSGRPMSQADAQIAAIARSRGAAIA